MTSPPSCPRLSRASTSFLRQLSKQGVDGRDKPGHDAGRIRGNSNKMTDKPGGQHMLASRRRVLTGAASLAITAAVGPAFAAMRPDDKFDLVIKGGEVLDPSQQLRGRRDIGIRYGVIEAVEPDIPAARALRTIDAGGKLVTPGLVDLHCHVYPYCSAIVIPADELITHQF